MHNARKYLRLTFPLALERGGVLKDVVLAYETFGTLNSDKSNAIMLFTGLSASAHVASSSQDPSPGWWESVVGAGKAVDTDRYFLVCLNSLGSCFGSTGPSSVNPDTAAPYGATFPALMLEDIARAGFHLVRALGIEQLNTLMGTSMGAMVVLAYAALFPGSARRLVSISGTMAARAASLALRSLSRDAIRQDPLWNGGNYAASKPPLQGLALARKLSLLSYRSPDYLDRRFSRRAPDPSRGETSYEFAVEAYLDKAAHRGIEHFDANSYLVLSRAIDLFDLARHDTASSVFAQAGFKGALVLGARTDALYTPEEQRLLAEALWSADVPTHYVSVDTEDGHDAFLTDPDGFSRQIAWFLENC